MWDYVKSHVEQVSGALLAILALVTVLGKYTSGLAKIGRWIKKIFKRGGNIEDALSEIQAAQTENAAKIQAVHYQLHPNGGGSLRDDVTAISAKIGFLLEVNSINYRSLPYPAFHCDSAGRNIAVSAAYQELLGLSSEEALSNLNWHGYIKVDDVADYFDAFKMASEGNSNFRHSARFRRSQEDQLGRWMVEAHRLNDGSYLGRFHPDDDLAREICKKNGWEG